MTDHEIKNYSGNNFDFGADHFDEKDWEDYLAVAKEGNRVFSVLCANEIQEESAWSDLILAIAYASWCSAMDNLLAVMGIKEKDKWIQIVDGDVEIDVVRKIMKWAKDHEADDA